MKKVALAGNVVIATFSQNLAWVDKKGNPRTFNEEQTFSTETITELTGRKVGLWMLGVLKHFCKLSRLQGKVGFKLSKPIELELAINNRTEKMNVKFSFSLKRVERMLQIHPAIVTEAFNAAPSIGNISIEKVKNYLTNAEDFVIAPSRRLAEKATTTEVVNVPADVETVTE